MFNFFKRRRAELDARTKIGIALHSQVMAAFDKDESETSKRLLTFFTAGYIHGFVRSGFFTLTGVIGEKASDKHIRRICDGVMPTKLWDDLVRKAEALKFARDLVNRDVPHRGSGPTPAEAIKLFEDGFKIGYHDASFPETFRGSWVHNLEKHLLGELDVEAFFESFFDGIEI